MVHILPGAGNCRRLLLHSIPVIAMELLQILLCVAAPIIILAIFLSLCDRKRRSKLTQHERDDEDDDRYW